MTKPFVKDAAGHFRNLIAHSLREHEPSHEHILKRLIKPLCEDICRILDEGTAADAKEAAELLSKECMRVS